MKRIVLIVILSLSLLLTGCSDILKREYRSVSRHVSQTSDEEDHSALRVETYSDLVNSVQYFVSTGEQEGIVHLYQYSGDVEQDLSDACQEVLTRDPLGCWALRDIEFTCNKIVSYYECIFTFDYRRSTEEISGLKTIVGSSAIRQALQECMSDYESAFLLETNSYYANKELLLSLIQEAYYNAPGSALGYPKVSISIYPEDSSAAWHIVEVSFSYLKSQTVLQQQAQQVMAQAAALTGVAPGEGEVGCWLLYSRLSEEMNYASDGDASVYAALVSGTADSQGAALAYHLLCSRAGIDCTTVQGTLDGAPHWWNIVCTNGIWRHVDVTAGDSQENFLHSDSEMLDRYVWDQTSYPKCADPVSEEETADSSDAVTDSPQAE